jgi:group I intron endonuclease
MQGIYKIINKLNGKYYVGSTMNFNRRWVEHKRQLNNGSHANIRLLRSWEKHGPNSFEFIVIEQLNNMNKSDILDIEQKYLDIAEGEKHISYNLSFKTRGWGLSIERLKGCLPKGDKHKNYIRDVYIFKQTLTNELFTGTRHNFYTKYNLSKNHVKELVTNKRLSLLGWIVTDGNNSNEYLPMAPNKENYPTGIYQFTNKKKDLTFTGSCFDFRLKYKTRKYKIEHGVRNGKIFDGWKCSLVSK